MIPRPEAIIPDMKSVHYLGYFAAPSEEDSVEMLASSIAFHMPTETDEMISSVASKISPLIVCLVDTPVGRLRRPSEPCPFVGRGAGVNCRSCSPAV